MSCFAVATYSFFLIESYVWSWNIRRTLVTKKTRNESNLHSTKNAAWCNKIALTDSMIIKALQKVNTKERKKEEKKNASHCKKYFFSKIATLKNCSKKAPQSGSVAMQRAKHKKRRSYMWLWISDVEGVFMSCKRIFHDAFNLSGIFE